MCVRLLSKFRLPGIFEDAEKGGRPVFALDKGDPIRLLDVHFPTACVLLVGSLLTESGRRHSGVWLRGRVGVLLSSTGIHAFRSSVINESTGGRMPAGKKPGEVTLRPAERGAEGTPGVR